jgi:hypothetical protein
LPSGMKVLTWKPQNPKTPKPRELEKEYNNIRHNMKIAVLTLLIVLFACSAYGRAFNNYVRKDTYGADMELQWRDDPIEVNETWIDFYFGLILGWQTQQKVPGQCYTDTVSYYKSLNLTLEMLLVSYLPAYWFNFLDRIRINIDSYSKSLQSCQVHSILLKLQRIVTMDGIIETAARLLTQVAFLKSYFELFTTNFADGNMTVAGTQLGKLSSAIIGVTVN